MSPMEPAPGPVNLDANASEPLRPEAREAMLRAAGLPAGNPSSAHAAGRTLRAALADAREAVAALAGAEPREVVLTSGATEANRLAVRGALAARPGAWALSAAEHAATLRLADRVETEGGAVRRTRVLAGGRADVADLADAARGASVVSLVLAQSVTGAIHDVARFAQTIAGRGAAVHCDATQGFGRIDAAAAVRDAELVSLSAHKFGGPAGAGALVVRGGAERSGRWLPPDGRVSQEGGRRGGTESVVLAAGMAAAARAALRDLAVRREHDLLLGDELRAGIRALGGEILGPARDSLPGTCLAAFDGCPGDSLLAALDASGILVSAGTACASLARTPPEVLVAAGMASADAARAVRFSVSWRSTRDDVARALSALRQAVPRVRAAWQTT